VGGGGGGCIVKHIIIVSTVSISRHAHINAYLCIYTLIAYMYLDLSVSIYIDRNQDVDI